VSSARVGFLGMYRDEETLQPVEYYVKLPGDLEQRDAIVLDPMLATGNSSAAAIATVKKAGARSVMLVCLVSAPEGVEHVHAELLTGPGQHLAERLAASDPEQLDLGLAARPGQPPDPLRELAHGQHHRVAWTAERHALARQQGRLRDEGRRVLHRDPVAHHP